LDDIRESGQSVFIDREHLFYPGSLDAEKTQYGREESLMGGQRVLPDLEMREG
jgi:hypothetical protein